MFSFFKRKKKSNSEISEEELQEARKKREEKDAQELAQLLEGEESYKIFSWGFGFHDDRHLKDSVLALKDWEPIEEVFSLIEKEYDNIEEGSMLLMIKDSIPRHDGDEIASLRIDIKYGYMRPYMKYREEGAIEAEEEKEYWAERPWDNNTSLEFDYDNFMPRWHLTKDINLVKKIFKEFYETGDVSEKYMH